MAKKFDYLKKSLLGGSSSLSSGITGAGGHVHGPWCNHDHDHHHHEHGEDCGHNHAPGEDCGSDKDKKKK